MESIALRARVLHKELRPLYGLIQAWLALQFSASAVAFDWPLTANDLQDMRKLADAVLLLFCRLNHQALGIFDAQSLNMTGWLELLATTIKVMLFSQSMPARLIVQLSTLASCLGQVQIWSAAVS